MTLPIPRDKLPEKIPIKKLVEIVLQSAGPCDKPPKREDFLDAFRGTRITQELSRGSFSREETKKFLEQVHEKFGFTSIKGQKNLKKELEKHQTQSQSPQESIVKKPSSPGFVSSFFKTVFGKPKTEQGGRFYNPQTRPGLSSSLTEPPSSSPSQNFQTPNLPPVKLPPGVKQ